ncbi:MAG: DNA-protecting protein DprA [bacterium]|nr:DNA-protecting protein DprA [bacterium]
MATRLERLALLLAGAGVRCRRRLGEMETVESPLQELQNAGESHRLLTRARHHLSEDTKATLAKAHEAGFEWVTPGDDAFPDPLRKISDPPLGLFVRGRWPAEQPAAAIVGSRKPTRYGIDVAAAVSEEAARAGVTIVSGMARGVDASAHQGALVADGHTVAVWGTGPGRIYPPENHGLAQAIAKKGALISEYPPGAPPRRHHFPQRNRIIVGLVDVILVVEAAARSGALLTARLGLDENRDIMAVPGSIFSNLSVGPNALLRAGARPLVTPRDLLDALGIDSAARVNQSVTPENEDGVLGIIGRGEAFDVDELAARSGRPVEELLADLLELELAGHVERLEDGKYARSRAQR